MSTPATQRATVHRPVSWIGRTEPAVDVVAPATAELDLPQSSCAPADFEDIDPGGRYWRPGHADFGSRRTPDFTFGDPHAAGIFHSVDDGAATIHNRGDEVVALLTLGTEVPLGLEILAPGTSAQLPAVDLLCYVQGARVHGSPRMFGVVWMSDGRSMPSTLPVPTRREFLDQHYLTPWSADWNGGYTHQDHRDADADGLSFQYRTGGSSITMRNTGTEWMAVLHKDGHTRSVTELAPGSQVSFPVSVTANTGQVFSVVGRREGGSPGRAPYRSASGTIHPGWPGRPGTATHYGSVVIMLGTVVYSALPKRNLYLAWSDRRRLRIGCRRRA